VSGISIRTLFVSFFCVTSLYSLEHLTVPWQRITAESDVQKVDTDTKILSFKKNVHAYIDDTVHINAPLLRVDYEHKRVWGKGKPESPLLIEYDGWIIWADQIVLDMQHDRGYANNVRIHTPGGFVRVGAMYRSKDGNWKLEDVSYSGCNAPHPHWQIHAYKAHVQDNKFYASNISFSWGRLPLLYMPVMQFPIQGAQSTGFLIPKISYDKEQGFGLQQELFVSLMPNIDTTVGINWRSRHGAVWSGEFRTCPLHDHYLTVNGWYGYDKKGSLDRFTGMLTRDSDYWVQSHGEMRWRYPVVGHYPHGHMIIDYGSDKRVSEHFFTAPSDRDDWFMNTVSAQWQDGSQSIDVSFRHDLYVRNQFVPTLKTPRLVQGEEEYTVRRVYTMPDVRWVYGWQCLQKQMQYSHECYIDFSVFRQTQHTIVYDTEQSSHLKNSESGYTGRLGYQGKVETWQHVPGGMIRLEVSPQVHARSHLELGTRLSGHRVKWYAAIQSDWFGAPLLVSYGKAYGVFEVQPIISYCFMPGKRDEAWFEIDTREPSYTQNTFTGALEGMWYGAGTTAVVRIQQPCYIGNQKDMYLLARSHVSGRGMPLHLSTRLESGTWQWKSQHEYNWYTNTFVHHQLGITFKSLRFEIGMQLAHYDPAHAVARELLFAGGTFVSCQAKWYYTHRLCSWYKSDWYYRRQEDVVVGLHQDFGVSYEGHCWKLQCGYEEKRYLHYGRRKKQRSFYMRVSFEELGTLGTKLKQWVSE